MSKATKDATESITADGVIALGDGPELPSTIMELPPGQQAQLAALPYKQTLQMVERAAVSAGESLRDDERKALLQADGLRLVALPLPLVDAAVPGSQQERLLYLQVYIVSVVNRHVRTLVGHGFVSQ